MASIAFVTALVFRLNKIFYDQNPRTMQVPCEGSEPVALEYWNPVLVEGRHEGYYPTQDADNATADSIKTIRVHNHIDGNTYWLVIDNADGVNKFTDMCNACCGTTPDMTTGITIPDVINELSVPANADGDSIYTFAVPQNAFTLDMLITALTYNGGQTVGATPTAGGYANTAAVVSWLNTNASAMGVWTSINAGKAIKLVAGTGVNSANLDLDLEAAAYCLNLPTTGVTIEVLTVKDNAGVDQNITIPATTFSEANRAAVVSMLQTYLPGTVAATAIGGTDWKINYSGFMKPVAVKSADLTTVNTAFTAGVCA